MEKAYALFLSVIERCKKDPHIEVYISFSTITGSGWSSVEKFEYVLRDAGLYVDYAIVYNALRISWRP